MELDVNQNEEYKETELGLLPKDWEVVRLGDYLDLLRNGITKKQNKRGRGLPVSRIETISSSKINPQKVGYIEGLTEQEIKKYKLQEGDILFSHINSEPYLGNSAIFENEPSVLIHGMNLLLLRVKADQLNSWFLNYLICFYRQKGIFIGIASRAVNQASINQGRLKLLPLPLPPLSEQKKIASVLSIVQEAKERTEDVIKATKELKKSMMKHLFTYGPVSLEEAEKVPLKETEIGPIPEGWEVVRLGDVVQKMKAGGTPKRGIKEYWDGGIPFALIEDITSCGLYLSKTKNTITEEGLKNSSAWIVPENSLLLSMYATIGETAINTIPLATNQAILGIIPKSNFEQVFGAYLLKFNAERLKMQNIQSTQKNVNKGIVESFKIPLPPLSEQKKIASILLAIDQKIEAEENKKKALEDLFKSLLHNLMTAKIRVNHLEKILDE